MTCGYCTRPIAGEPVEILDAMPGEPTIACQPCHAHYRLGAPADPGPGTPCPYCDEASFVDEGGACIHCGVLRVDRRYVVLDVSVGSAGLTARPAVFDTRTTRTVKVYRSTERSLAIRHADRLNRES